MNNKRLEGFYNIIVAIIFFELVLGGLGNLFGYPVRKVLFIIGILFTLLMMFINKVKIRKAFLIPILVVLLYVGYGSIVGLLNNNNIRDIFSDANSFLGIIYILLLVNYHKDDTNKIKKTLSIFINASTMVALMTIGLFFYSRIYLPADQSIIVKYMGLNDRLHYGFISGLVYSNNYARVYLFNGIFMQLGTALLAVRLFNNRYETKVLDTIKLAILVIGIYVSNTRGFWLATIGVIALVIIYYLLNRKKYQLTIKRFLIVFIIFISFAGILPKTIDANYVPPNTNVGTESIKDRVESIVDFEGDISNKIRALQLKFLMGRIKEKPVLGWGFGAHINEYTEYMIANNLPPALSGNFELYYVELLFKTGVIGILFLLIYLIIKFMQIIKLLIQRRMSNEDEQILVGWTIGTLSILASTVTNPYLASLSVFFVLVMEVYILEVLNYKYR